MLDLRAVPLEALPFRGARQLISDIRRRTHLVVDYHPTGPLSLCPRLEVAVYRITQEALTNVEQHARGQRIRVELTATPGDLR